MTFRMSTIIKLVVLLLCAGLIVGCFAGKTTLPEATRAINNRPTAAPTLPPTGPRPVTVAAPRSEIKLTILHTNDSRGYVDPCG